MKEEQDLLPKIDTNHQIKSIRRKNISKMDENQNSNKSQEKGNLNS
jgi:hypothetical protein